MIKNPRQLKENQKQQTKQHEHGTHYLMYAHVRPYRPQGPCVRMKYALSHMNSTVCA